jgi:hypothetical protein
MDLHQISPAAMMVAPTTKMEEDWWCNEYKDHMHAPSHHHPNFEGEDM